MTQELCNEDCGDIPSIIACDDGDPCTIDFYDENCNCKNEEDLNDFDGDGDGDPDACDPNDLDPSVSVNNGCDDILCGSGFNVNTICDDHNPCTINDRWDSRCNCVMELICIIDLSN